MRNQQNILNVRSIIKTDCKLFDSYVSWIILMAVTVIQFEVGTEPKLSNIHLSFICVRKQTMASMVVVQYVKYSVHFLLVKSTSCWQKLKDPAIEFVWVLFSSSNNFYWILFAFQATKMPQMRWRNYFTRITMTNVLGLFTKVGVRC